MSLQLIRARQRGLKMTPVKDLKPNKKQLKMMKIKSLEISYLHCHTRFTAAEKQQDTWNSGGEAQTGSDKNSHQHLATYAIWVAEVA